MKYRQVVASEIDGLSHINRLLRSVSWEGNAKKYRSGGRGIENVLTTEVMQALDFLPRTHFLGEVIRQSRGASVAVRNRLFDQIEEAAVRNLPGESFLRPSQKAYQKKVSVQPDATIATRNVYVFVEAKRIKSSSFQSEQLARELVCVIRESRERHPILLLILGSPPPVKVSGIGLLGIEDAIRQKLARVLAYTEEPKPCINEVEAKLGDSIAWTTWNDIAQVAKRQLGTFRTDSISVMGSVHRTCESIIAAIDRHS